MTPNEPHVHSRHPRLPDASDRARYEEALRCNRCGFCTSFCPTYLATGEEGFSPRGRNQAFRALLEGRLENPGEAERFFSSCLQCGICTSVCFSEVPTAKLMSAAREKGLQGGGEPWLQKFLLRFLLPRPRLLEWTLRPLFLAKRLGISRLLNRLGLLRLVSPRLAAAEELAEDVPLRFLRSRLKKRFETASAAGMKGSVDKAGPGAGREPDAVYFLSCGSNYLRPRTGEATAALLDRSGVRWGCSANVCCGLPGASTGDRDAARSLAKRNIAELERHSAAVILIDDSSCASALKEYPAWFEGEGAETAGWRRRAEAVAARVKDLSEWLVNSPVSLSRLRETAARSRRKEAVTYHDPCKARYAQKIVAEPRTLLHAVPGIDYRELPEADQCCGGGGTASFLNPEMSRAVLDRKTRCIDSTGADVVVTSSVSCLLQLAFGLRRARSSARAVHLSEFLVERVD